MTISVGNLIVAGGATVDTSEVLSALNKQGLKVWVGTKTQRDALPENVKNDDKITFLTYDSEEDIYLIIDTIISYSKTWSSVKISTELAKKINSSDVYTKTEVMQIINSKVASALKYRGAVATVAALPSSGQENGDSYYVQADGYMYAWSSDYSDWQALGSATDMTNYYTKSEVDALLADMAVKFQYPVMPNADSTTVGKIIQYTGADTNDYKNGYWYKGVDNGDSTYSWIIDPAYYTSDVVDALHTAKYYNATNAPDCDTLTEIYVLVNAGSSHVENHYPAQDLFFVKTICSDTDTDAFQTAIAYGAIDTTQKGVMYSRVKTNGTWSSWQKLATTDSTCPIIQLSGTVDCNTLTQNALYVANSLAVTALSNAPIDAQVQLDGGFSILVNSTNTSSATFYGTQIFMPYGSDMPFIRKGYYLNGQSWTSWEQLVTTDDIFHVGDRRNVLAWADLTSDVNVDGSSNYANNVGRIDGRNAMILVSNPSPSYQWPVTNSGDRNIFLDFGSYVQFFVDTVNNSLYVRSRDSVDMGNWGEIATKNSLEAEYTDLTPYLSSGWSVREYVRGYKIGKMVIIDFGGLTSDASAAQNQYIMQNLPYSIKNRAVTTLFSDKPENSKKITVYVVDNVGTIVPDLRANYPSLSGVDNFYGQLILALN